MIKQIIIIRKDLKMRRGKEIAQGAHASILFMVKRLQQETVAFSEAESFWICHNMAKVCLQVDTEQELLDVHDKAKAAGLESHVILDSGKTEFGGVPTYTACAIGPDEAEKIDKITGLLKLY